MEKKFLGLGLLGKIKIYNVLFSFSFMATYSHSKLSTFEQCPLRFKFKYIDKLIPDIEKTIEAHLGSMVHDTLEWIYNEVRNNHFVPNLDEVIEHYATHWQQEYSENIVVVKNNMTTKNYFDKGVQFLIDYYVKHQPFKDGTIECEKKITLELGENGEHNIVGYIDRLVYDEENDRYEVHDYKTANSLPTKEKVESDRQLALYSIAVKNTFGQEKDTLLVWHYLAHNTKITSTRTENELEQLKKDILELIHKIESATEFPARKSILCNWCEFKETCKKFHMDAEMKNHESSYFAKITCEKKIERIKDIPVNKDGQTSLDIW